MEAEDLIPAWPNGPTATGRAVAGEPTISSGSVDQGFFPPGGGRWDFKHWFECANNGVGNREQWRGKWIRSFRHQRSPQVRRAQARSPASGRIECPTFRARSPRLNPPLQLLLRLLSGSVTGAARRHQSEESHSFAGQGKTNACPRSDWCRIAHRNSVMGRVDHCPAHFVGTTRQSRELDRSDPWRGYWRRGARRRNPTEGFSPPHGRPAP